MFVFIKFLFWEFLFINYVVGNIYSENYKKYLIWDFYVLYVFMEIIWEFSG